MVTVRLTDLLRIVSDRERAQTHNAALAEYIGRAALVRHWALKSPAPETLGPAPVPLCEGNHNAQIPVRYRTEAPAFRRP
jgi:hypothetical protein